MQSLNLGEQIIKTKVNQFGIVRDCKFPMFHKVRLKSKVILIMEPFISLGAKSSYES